ncbi:helix-turn-helix domain-containing protein [Bacillus halotolerans]|nr:helix-turn-helix domain-containing protein [Bacillus halotolerans]MEC3639149.1 helix-turn-helix domain containing protein [Bacillus halotolerans]
MTLKSVAEQANVTQGTVYYHFRTKERWFVMCATVHGQT